MSATVFGQNYVSRKQHINTINGDYVLGQANTYFTIDGDKIINTNKKGKKVFATYTMGEIKKGDNITRWSFNSAGTTGKAELVRRTKDTFTEKSFSPLTSCPYEAKEINSKINISFFI